MFKDLIYIQLNTIHKTNFDKNSTVARTSGLDCTIKRCVDDILMDKSCYIHTVSVFWNKLNSFEWLDLSLCLYTICTFFPQLLQRLLEWPLSSAAAPARPSLAYSALGLAWFLEEECDHAPPPRHGTSRSPHALGSAPQHCPTGPRHSTSSHPAATGFHPPGFLHHQERLGVEGRGRTQRLQGLLKRLRMPRTKA